MSEFPFQRSPVNIVQMSESRQGDRMARRSPDAGWRYDSHGGWRPGVLT